MSINGRTVGPSSSLLNRSRITSPSHSHTSSEGSVSSLTSSKTNNPFPARSDPLPEETLDDNASSFSSHTLRTLRNTGSGSDEDDDEEGGTPRVIHIRSDDGGEGGGRPDPSALTSMDRRRLIVRALSKLAILFVVCAAVAGGTLYLALPEIDDEDRKDFRIPKNFEQLKALNVILQRYKDENFGRVMLCWIIVYMFLQAFSIPGSMYMSILAGAMWGVPLALPIVCASVATGATICYLISKFLGQVLIAIPSWKARVDGWKDVLDRQSGDMLSYMIVIRMMPLPPHNIVNILAPHLGISISLFWVSTFFGIFAVSVIHTTIGEKLDQMTSPADFNLFTVRNALLLGGVCAAVMIPVVLKRRSGVALDPLEEVPAQGAGRVRLEGEEGPLGGHNNGHYRSLMGRRRVGGDSHGYDESDEDDELPPVRKRGGIAGFSSRLGSGHRNGGTDHEALLEDDADSDGRPGSRGSMDVPETDEESLPGFDDRREQGTARSRSTSGNNTNGRYPHPHRYGHRNGNSDSASRGARQGKAARVLGFAGPGNPRLPRGGPQGSSNSGASITDSLTGLWGKLTRQ